ncbi:MAG: sensor histidine kinase [Candidatus Marinarcus sp.]|uniref:sensor histidine kinase n=1 Tax=Candidatus Marinarcus sp. TaxID=3100987 RepID=UPI003AFF94DE
MFNEKNLPKLILLSPIFFILLIIVVVTYLQISDFNKIYEDETNELHEIIAQSGNNLMSQDKIDRLIQKKLLNREKSIKKVVLVAFFVLIIMSFFAYFISKKITSILNRYKKDIEFNQNKLKNINQTLEEKVKKKTRKLEKFNKKLKNEILKEVNKNRQKDGVLFQQSKMVSMGEMLENVAHQWRQPLSIISSSASGMVLKMEYNLFHQDEAKNELNLIVQTTKELSSTIDIFNKYFSKSESLEYFNVTDAINSNLQIMDSSMKSNHIDIIKRFKDDITIFGFKNEFAQAIMNIINNAKDVLLQNIDIKYRRLICIELYKDKANTIITIIDNGGGIDETILDKIFDPYFTTKDKTQGTGIGLYLSREIIVNHMKGELSVKNDKFIVDGAEYLGAKFSIILKVQESMC